MRISINTDTHEVSTTPSTLLFKAGSWEPIEVTFTPTGGSTTLLDDGATIEFAVTNNGVQLVYASDFSPAGGNVYAALASFFGESLLALVNTTNPSKLSAEVAWTVGGKAFRSNTITVAVYKPEIPLLGGGAADPDPYPTAAQLLASLAALAPLNNAALTGMPTAPTAALGTNTTQLATTAFVKAAFDALVAGAPGALDTLKELADQLGNDENASAALANTIASIQTALTTKATNRIYATTNFVAVAYGRYQTVGTITVTDPTSPTPVAGDIYEVIVASGTAVIGGVTYTSSRVPVVRVYIGSAWINLSNVLTDNLILNGTHNTAPGQVGVTPAAADLINKSQADALYAADPIFTASAFQQFGMPGTPTLVSGGYGAANEGAMSFGSGTAAGNYGVMNVPGLYHNSGGGLAWGSNYCTELTWSVDVTFGVFDTIGKAVFYIGSTAAPGDYLAGGAGIGWTITYNGSNIILTLLTNDGATLYSYPSTLTGYSNHYNHLFRIVLKYFKTGVVNLYASERSSGAVPVLVATSTHGPITTGPSNRNSCFMGMVAPSACANSNMSIFQGWLLRK